jgi:hypothetical protein
MIDPHYQCKAGGNSFGEPTAAAGRTQWRNNQHPETVAEHC